MADDTQREVAAEKPPKAPKAEKPPKAEGEVYVLDANFGEVINGKHAFWEKGTEFDQEKDAELIAFFHRKGAPIKMKD